MYDRQKMIQLEQRSHNRGLLSKQFYNKDIDELERKRMLIKLQLDKQVAQRQRQKERKKAKEQELNKKQQENIRNYYKNLQNRQKRVGNQSVTMTGSNMKQYGQPYMTYPHESQVESRFKQNNNTRPRVPSKPNLINEGDIPLLSLGQNQNVLLNQSNNVTFQNKQNVIINGNIPLLDLSDDQNSNKFKKIKTKTKRQKTLQSQSGQSHILPQQQSKVQIVPQVPQIHQNHHYNNPNSNFLSVPIQSQVKQSRKNTLPDQQSMKGSIVRQHQYISPQKHEHGFIPQQIQLFQQQNKQLKNELKKNQQALSLLIGAVKSNGKFDKYRVQAEKILHANIQQSKANKKSQDEESKLMLPKINVKHQSIMYDYLINAAKRGKKTPVLK